MRRMSVSLSVLTAMLLLAGHSYADFAGKPCQRRRLPPGRGRFLVRAGL